MSDEQIPDSIFDDYEIGYKKPPKDTQFKPGQSGNPKGRPKKVFQISVMDILAETITVNKHGKKVAVHKQDAFIQSLLAHAIKGNQAAAKNVIDLLKNLNNIDVM